MGKGYKLRKKRKLDSTHIPEKEPRTEIFFLLL